MKHTWVLPVSLLVIGGAGLAGCEKGGTSARSEAAPAAALSPRSDLIPAGQKAPDFDAVDQAGRHVHLADLLKKTNVVLVFYPGDFTPGCTKQLCAIRDDWSQFEKHGATVLGVNPGDAVQHARFVGDHKFQFPLIVDEGSKITAAYGAKGPEKTQRTVYAIRKDGTVALADRGFVEHDKIFAALK